MRDERKYCKDGREVRRLSLAQTLVIVLLRGCSRELLEAFCLFRIGHGLGWGRSGARIEDREAVEAVVGNQEGHGESDVR